MMPPHLPSHLQRLLAGYGWHENRDGMSGVHVYRLHKSGAPDLFLKLADDPLHLDLLPECERMQWLRGKLPVPEVIDFGQDAGQQWLLMTAVPGHDTSQPYLLRDPQRLVTLLAEGLRLIHKVDWRDCPFQRSADMMIAAACDRVLQGQVDETDFDDERQGQSAQSLLELLTTTRPAVEELCFVHGDYCLPNILVNGDHLSGFIDWGRAGVADRYQDLALAERSIVYNLSPEWVQPFFEAYGLPHIDAERLAFYKLLDEFF